MRVINLSLDSLEFDVRKTNSIHSQYFIHTLEQVMNRFFALQQKISGSSILDLKKLITTLEAGNFDDIGIACKLSEFEEKNKLSHEQVYECLCKLSQTMSQTYMFRFLLEHYSPKKNDNVPKQSPINEIVDNISALNYNVEPKFLTAIIDNINNEI
jgi:hypothetical protein